MEVRTNVKLFDLKKANRQGCQPGKYQCANALAMLDFPTGPAQIQMGDSPSVYSITRSRSMGIHSGVIEKYAYVIVYTEDHGSHACYRRSSYVVLILLQ